MSGFFPKWPNFGKSPPKASPFEETPEQTSPQETSSKTAESQERMKEEMGALLASHGPLFSTFAEDVSLTFTPSNFFAIDLEKGIVHFDLSWFAEQNYSKEQVVWAAFHELSHFRDLAKDPKRMFENFEYIKRCAKRTSVKISARVKELGKTPNPTAAEQMAYEIHHTFFNILDDIFVNNLVSERAPVYEPKKEGGKLVRDLYRRKLFPGTDYRAKPRHLQLMYALLRQEMVPDEKIMLSEEVSEILEKTRITHEKKHYTLREFVDAFLKPQSKADTRAGERYRFIKKYIEPLFDQVLEKDIAEWELPPEKDKNQEGEGEEGDSKSGEKGKSSEGGSGSPQPFEKEYKEFKKRHIDQIDEKDIEKFTKEQIEVQKKKIEESIEEAAAKAQKKLDEEWCNENEISPASLERFKKNERLISPYLEELSLLWQKIVFGAGSKQERKMQSGFKRGVDLDIGRTIAGWPEIQAGHADDARIMRRMGTETVPVPRPNLIRVRVLADNSSSMRGEGKIEVQDQAITLTLSSLDEFNTHLNRTRDQTGSALRVETELWSFGRRTRLIKPSGHEDPDWNERAQMIRSMGEINGQEGSTNDAHALAAIRSSMDTKHLEAVRSGEIMEIVFLITDGGSDSVERAREEVRSLETSGVIARAFQIGSVGMDERRSFENVWNQAGRERGLVVGSDIARLTPAIAAALKEHLSGVEL
ncbi:MAG: vWA domain-containing protein [Minisyncoccia bacterium]